MLEASAYSHNRWGPLSCVAQHADVARSLKMKTGFNASEIFRKYLWYLLRERKFDSEAVSDLVQLKASLQLSDEEVSCCVMTHAFIFVHDCR